MVSKIVKLAMKAGVGLNGITGSQTMLRLTRTIKKIIPSFPLWSNQLAVSRKLNIAEQNFERGRETVVYFSTCISRVIGEPRKSDKGVMQTLIDVSAKAKINVIIPAGIEHYCCGQIFSSKGFTSAFSYSANKTIYKLWQATDGGSFPVVLDISSCTQTLLNCRKLLSSENKVRFDTLKIIDSIEYIADYLLPELKIIKKKGSIILHPVCSIQKMDGVQLKFNKIAAHFAEQVTQPLFAGCCGMAGDRGFLFPELTRSATFCEAQEANNSYYDGYYSSSKTCEIAMSEAVGKNYHSILNLVDETT
ncbi:sn-glycerol-3-phosphate dehydrogenase subunit C [compost metagenome]